MTGMDFLVKWSTVNELKFKLNTLERFNPEGLLLNILKVKSATGSQVKNCAVLLVSGFLRNYADSSF